MQVHARGAFARAVIGCGLVAAALPLTGAAQVNDAPLTEKWAPAPWGADDTAGAVNRITPQMVLSAAGLIQRGKFATLGKVYQSDMPFFGGRGFHLTIPGLPTGGAFGNHQAIYNDELVTAEIGQVGTQFDGPGHIGVLTSKGSYFYNGRMLERVAHAHGLGPLGVEHVAQKGFVCRGVLLDAAAYRGVEMLTPPKGGDATDPGNLTGADTWPTEAVPGERPENPFECHVQLQTRHGIWNLENLDLTQLAEEKVYEFLFAWSPLKIKGATGSPGNPIAIY